MSRILDNENFGLKLYNTLPRSYREDDTFTKFALKRYLQALADGGFSNVIKEINGLLDIVNPDKIRTEDLPELFKSYGMEIFNGIPETYLRKLLPVVSELYSMKGTFTAVEFLTSIISGVKSTVEVDTDFDINHGVNVRLEMDYEAEGIKGLPDKNQLLRIIEEYVPFFCNVVVIYTYLFMESSSLFLNDENEFDSLVTTLNEVSALAISDGFIQKLKMSAVEESITQEFLDNTSITGDNNTLIGESLLLNNMQSYDKITDKGITTYVFN